jgi:hypothetical protein
VHRERKAIREIREYKAIKDFRALLVHKERKATKV